VISNARFTVPPDQLCADKVTIDFLYPFKIDRWESLRDGLHGLLDESNDDLAESITRACEHLESDFGRDNPYSGAAISVLSGCGDADGSRNCDAAVLKRVRRQMEPPSEPEEDEFLRPGHDLARLEMETILWAHERAQPEQFIDFLAEVLRSDLSRCDSVTPRAGESSGTRGYLEYRRPSLELSFPPRLLAVGDHGRLPDLSLQLPFSEEFGRPCLVLRPSVRLMSTGFGCLRLKLRLASPAGLKTNVNVIAFTAQGKPDVQEQDVAQAKDDLAGELREAIVAACEDRRASRLFEILEAYEDRLETEPMGRLLERCVREVTIVNGALATHDIVDAANLDRGTARGQEPVFSWHAAEGRRDDECLESFAGWVLRDELVTSLREGLLKDRRARSFVKRKERRRSRHGAHARSPESHSVVDHSRVQLMTAVSGLKLQGSSMTLEEHPYVSTFLSLSPDSGSELSDGRSTADRFKALLQHHKSDLLKILMKTKWVDVRSDWASTRRSIENIFHSDLIHMAVDIRSTLCVHYAPPSMEQYMEFPELAYGHKYRRELSDVLVEQRTLWYAYSISDRLLTHDIRTISAKVDVLKQYSLDERFPEAMEGLADVVRSIDSRKTTLAEVMEDPSSRKGGSSLFTTMIDRTSSVFRLEELRDGLHQKLDRIDMLGIHVNQNVQQYSNLIVQEGSRSAQLTLEFLEAFVVAFYFAELAKMANESMPPKPEGAEPVVAGLLTMIQNPLETPYGYFLLALGGFLTALPLITMIRQGRSRFSFENPPWLETLERTGMVVGPAVLLTFFFLFMVATSGAPPAFLAAGLICVYVGLVSLWFEKTSRSLTKMSSRLKRTFGGAEGQAATQPEE